MDNDDIHKTGILNMFSKDHVRDREFHLWQETCFKLNQHQNGSELNVLYIFNQDAIVMAQACRKSYE